MKLNPGCGGFKETQLRPRLHLLCGAVTALSRTQNPSKLCIFKKTERLA